MRLSEAVFQGQISRLRFSLLEVFVSYLFLLSGSVSDVSALLAVAVLRDLGSNPADLGSNPAAV